MVLAQKEFKVGGYPVTDFKVENYKEVVLTCKAGPLDVVINKEKNIAVYGVSEVGFFKKTKIAWNAQYSEGKFWFHGGKEGEPVMDMLLIGTHIKKDGLYFGVGFPEDIALFRRAGVTGEKYDMLNFDGVKQALKLHKKGKLELNLKVQTAEGCLKNFEQIVAFEKAIKQAAAIYDDLQNLKSHPEVEKFASGKVV